LEIDKRRIIINTINYGQWRHWIVNYYGEENIKQFIENTPISEFRPRALKLVSILLGIKNFEYESRDDKLKKAKDLSKA
jgi:hypothetical protein